MPKTFTKLLTLLTCISFLSTANAQVFPLTFEDATITYDIFGFGDADFNAIPAEIIANPDATGENTSGMVAHINKTEGAQTWAGASLPLAAIIDQSQGSVFEMKVWSPRTGVPIQLKFEDIDSPPDANGNPSIIAEVAVNTTVANAWETLSFDMSLFAGYDAANEYDQAVIFPDFGQVGVAGGESFYFDDLQIPAAPTVVQSMPLTFEDAGVEYQADGFGDVTTAFIANPDASGDNTSGMVLHMNKPMGAQPWAGAALPIDAGINMIGNVLEMKVWSPRANIPFLLKIEDRSSPPDANGNPSIIAEVMVNNTMANTWETLSFDMSTFAAYDINNNYDQVVVFADFNTNGMGEDFYIDDIRNPNAVSISETELAKVQMSAYPNPADQVLNVSFDIPVSGNVSVSMVDILGRMAKESTLGNLNAGAHIEEMTLNNLSSGTYVLLLRLDGQLIKTQTVIVR